jgi:hypothetical protein
MKGLLLASVVSLGTLAAAIAGCTSSSDTPHETIDSGSPPDSGGADSATDAGPTCFMNPRTHFEIINACTDAQSFDKNPRLPLLQPDGSLPPLP